MCLQFHLLQIFQTWRFFLEAAIIDISRKYAPCYRAIVPRHGLYLRLVEKDFSPTVLLVNWFFQ